jgi:hypothetical protein
VGGEGSEDFALLALRDLEEVEGPSKFRCNFIEFRGRDAKVPMGLLKAEWRLARLGRRELEGAARNVADPECSHEFEAGQPSQVLGMPFPQLRVLGLLADDRVLHHGVAEVIHHRCNGEDASQTFVKTFLRILRVGLVRPRQNIRRCGGHRQPCDHASSGDRSGNSLCHGYLLVDSNTLGPARLCRQACNPRASFPAKLVGSLRARPTTSYATA